MNSEAWQASIHRVVKSQTLLKRQCTSTHICQQIGKNLQKNELLIFKRYAPAYKSFSNALFH